MVDWFEDDVHAGTHAHKRTTNKQMDGNPRWLVGWCGGEFSDVPDSDWRTIVDIDDYDTLYGLASQQPYVWALG